MECHNSILAYARRQLTAAAVPLGVGLPLLLRAVPQQEVGGM